MFKISSPIFIIQSGLQLSAIYFCLVQRTNDLANKQINSNLLTLKTVYMGFSQYSCRFQSTIFKFINWFLEFQILWANYLIICVLCIDDLLEVF